MFEDDIGRVLLYRWAWDQHAHAGYAVGHCQAIRACMSRIINMALYQITKSTEMYTVSYVVQRSTFWVAGEVSGRRYGR